MIEQSVELLETVPVYSVSTQQHLFHGDTVLPTFQAIVEGPEGEEALLEDSLTQARH